MRRWKPSLEGSLAIFNVVSLLAMFLLLESTRSMTWVRPFETVMVIWLWILSLPITAPCALLVTGWDGQFVFESVLLCIATGVNAVVWGRSVGWVLRRTLLARFAQAMDDDTRPEPAQGDDTPMG